MSDRPDFLGLEPLIVARLKEVLESRQPATVLTMSDVDGVTEASLPKPSVRVAYFGHQVVQDKAPLPPGWALIEQTWLAVPAVRNVRHLRDNLAGDVSRAEASPLCDAVLDALEGWRPGGGYGVLSSVTPPLRPATLEGCTFIPFAFVSRFRRSQSCA